MHSYNILRVTDVPVPGVPVAHRHNPWQDVPVARIDAFRPEGTPGHRPDAHVRVVHDGATLCARFDVSETHIRCVNTGYMVPTCRDSCVELFLQPPKSIPYFNFEINCGGALWCSYIRDAERTPGGFADFTPFTRAECSRCTVQHTMPATTEPERVDRTDWSVEIRIPFALLASFTGGPLPLEGTTWRGNFYKCAEHNTRPHWAAWSPVSAVNFHVPAEFGALRFL